MQQYQKSLQQISTLKREITQLKSTIQKLKTQLQGEKSLKQQLISKCDAQQKRITDYNKKITELQNQQNQITAIYEDQIIGLKNLIDQKSHELQQISLKILPNFDQDMIRIKILNELQLPHRQEIEDMTQQIKRLHGKILQLQRSKQSLTQKLQTIEKYHEEEMKKKDRKHSEEIEKITKQMNDIINRDNFQKQQIRRAKRQSEEIKNKLNNFKKIHQQTLQDMEKQNNRKLNTYEFEHEVKNLKKELEGKTTQIKLLKQQNHKIRNDQIKTKQQYNKLNNRFSLGQQHIRQLQQQIKTLNQRNQGLKAQVQQKQQINDKIKKYRIQIEDLKIQRNDHQNRIKQLQKQLYNTQQNLKQTKNKYLFEDKKTGIFVTTKNNNQDLESVNDLLRIKNENLSLIQRLTNKQKQLQRIIQETQELKKNRYNQKRNKYDESESNVIIQNLRSKLKEANTKIVQLIKQKIAYSKKNQHLK